MPYRDQNPGYPQMRDPKDSQFSHSPSEGSDRGHPYHQRECSAGGSVTLPPISPYDTYSHQQQGYPQDQRPYSESYQPPAATAYPADYARVSPQVGYGQSAPRQRTAIACRYCRRRKIRCSGFDQNPDGRCVNCQRFQQECIFTPVSSQAQAFVPAHAVYPGMRNMGIGPDGRPRIMYPQGAPLYGAHGQPLPPPVIHQGSPYDYPAPSPTGSYSSYGCDERGAPLPSDPSRARMQHDPHHPTILPPLPGQLPPLLRTDHANRGQFDEDLRLPPVTPTATSPGAAYSPGSTQSTRHPGFQNPPNSQYVNPPDPRADLMRLNNIMERRPDTEIDRNMLGRLGRRG